MTRRLAISLNVLSNVTVDDTVRFIDKALTKHARAANISTLETFPEGEHRGVVTGHYGVTLGTFRIVGDEVKPEQLADEIIARIPEASVRTQIAEAIRRDRQLVAGVMADPDF